MGGEGRRSIPEEEMSIDEHVWVQLTQNGKKTYDEYCKAPGTKPSNRRIDQRGWCSLPLREWGQIFSRVMSIASLQQW